MAEKIRNVKVEEGSIENEKDDVQQQILKELRDINRSTLYSSHKENSLIAFISMIITGIGGLIILSSMFTSETYEDVITRIPIGFGMAIIGIALYMGRSIFEYSINQKD